MAESTRMKYGLKTFSHTTLGRTFKSMEVYIKAAGEAGLYAVEEAEETGKTEIITSTPREEQGKNEARRFPSKQATGARRRKMARFFSGFSKEKMRTNISRASLNLVKEWQCKTTRLLI